METLKKVDWKHTFAALAALGVVSSAEPQAAIMGIVAMIIVWVINLAARVRQAPIGRGWITLIVYGAAFGMALGAHPVAFSWPVWNGDPTQYTAQLAMIISDVGPVALAVTGAATLLYNSLQVMVDKELNKLLGE